ncbi:MAG: peptidase MA family metallohydrolase [Chloroflexota bacterium]
MSHTFGEQMVFTLAAHADSDIISAALLIRVGDDAHTEVVEVVVTPAPRLEAEVRRDLQTRPIPPFTPVVYFWRLADAGGEILSTPEQAYLYDDNRFEWQTIRRGAVAAHWYGGDLPFGQSIADTGYESLDRVSRFINASPPDLVNVYVYANVSDLQSGLRLGGRTWVGGHADPALGVVLVAASPDANGLLSLQHDLPHELTHVMVYQAVGAGYDRMPVWLDEGLAVNAELEPNADFAIALADAAKKAGAIHESPLLSLESLCASFGVDPAQALLSYAESASVVRYVLDRWGPDGVGDLLAAYRDGATCEGGVQRALNVTLAQLQADWQNDVLDASPVYKFLRDLTPALLVFCPTAIIIALLIFVPKRKK